MSLCDSYAHDNTLGIELVREVLCEYGGKTCLDVGCGLMERPAYMIDKIEWTGIDPQNAEHDFPFVCCGAEKLPFKVSSFDSVLFATSIDHVQKPKRAIREAIRVLKPGGHLIIWLTLRPKDKKKNLVRRKKSNFILKLNNDDMNKVLRRDKNMVVIHDRRGVKNGWYDDRHQWGFTEQSLQKLVGLPLVERINIKWGVNIFIWTYTV